MNEPSPTFHGTSLSASARTGQIAAPHSMRSRRTATWARPRNSDDGYSRYPFISLANFILGLSPLIWHYHTYLFE